MPDVTLLVDVAFAFSLTSPPLQQAPLQPSQWPPAPGTRPGPAPRNALGSDSKIALTSALAVGIRRVEQRRARFLRLRERFIRLREANTST